MAVKASASITLSFMVDIKATYRYYKLQASTASAPSAPTAYPPSSSSGWDDVEPRYTSGSTNTLYFVDCTVFTNNTFAYSAVSKSSSYEAAKEAFNKAVAAGNAANSANNKIDNLQIGGRNLLLGSTNPVNKFDWHGANGSVTKTEETMLGAKGILLNVTAESTSWQYCSYAFGSSRMKLIKPGTYYTLSFDVYPSINDTIMFWIADGNSSNAVAGNSESKNIVANQWNHISLTIKTYSTITISGQVIYIVGINSLATYKICNFKLEEGNKATDWTPAPEDVDAAINAKIASVDVEYYLSTSATSLSGGSWVTTAPEWVNGKYMWSRTKITNGAGTVTYKPSSNGTCIAGAKGDTGATGATGATGNGVKTIVEQYYKSTSATSLSGGSWSTTYPGWENGKYIWTRSVITYTNNSTATTDAVCVTGQKGDTGATGKGVKSSAVTYQASTSGTTIPTGTWSTSIPSVSDGSYLWTRTIITYTDNSTTTSYSVGKMGDTGATGATGPQGPTGADGKGVKSTEITYQAWSNGTSTPTGTWSSSPPATSASKPYLWTRTIITYTDNTTSTSYSVGSTPEGIVVGGRNLALQTKDFTASNQYWSINSLFTRSVDIDGFTVMSASRTFASDAYWNRLIPHKYIPVEDMHNGITVSFDFKCDNLSNLDNGCVCSLQTYNASNAIIGQFESQNIKTLAFTKLDKPLSDGIWVRASVVFTEEQLKTHNANYTDDDVSYASVSFQLVKNGSIHFRKIKIEYGNKATDWSPAPEDVDEKIDDAAKVATNYLDFTEGTGLVIGDMTSETLGNNVLIDSDSVDIRNGTTVNASFGASKIELGKNNDNARIKLVNDRMTINVAKESLYNLYWANIVSKYLILSSIERDDLFDTSVPEGGWPPYIYIKRIDKKVTVNNVSDILYTGTVYVGCEQAYISIDKVEEGSSSYNSTGKITMYGSSINVESNAINFKTGNSSLTKNSNYRIYGGRVIYSNSSGSTGTITLSETAANFSFLEIHYGNSNYQLTTRVYSPNGKKVPLFFDYMANSKTHQILTKKVTISKTSITTDTSYSGYGNIIDGGTIYVGTENKVKIYYVIGFE